MKIKSYKFGRTKEEADELFVLVVSGKKTATCSLYSNPKEISKIGEKYYITNSDKTKRIIVQTTKVEIKRFCDVDAEFAYKEGEGDLSLDYWRRTHKEFFTKELGTKLSEDTLLECEEFKVIELEGIDNDY